MWLSTKWTIKTICKHKKIQKKIKEWPMSSQDRAKKNNNKKKMNNTKIKIKCVGGGGGPIFSICSVWSLTQCHSWNSLPCSHQHTFIIATFYRPPATTISYDSTSSSPEKENTSSNRLGPPPPPLDGGLRSQKGLRPFNPLQRIEQLK